MKNTIVLLALFSSLGLVACNKTPDTVLVPVPVPTAGPAGATGAVGEKGPSGQSGDAGIQGKPGKAGDEGIQGAPGKSGGNTTIIIPPPAANMPPDIVPDSPSGKPAN